MLDSFKLYGAIGVVVLVVALGGAVKVLWDRNASLVAEVAQKEAEVTARDRAIAAVEKVAQEAADRAASLQPIREEVRNAPAGGCVGPAVRSALDGLRRQAGTGHP